MRRDAASFSRDKKLSRSGRKGMPSWDSLTNYMSGLVERMAFTDSGSIEATGLTCLNGFSPRGSICEPSRQESARRPRTAPARRAAP